MRLGSYWMDAENTHEYPGPDLLHLRLGCELSDRWELYGRMLNLTDGRHAESATFNAARGKEFAPGNRFSVFADVELALR